MKSAEPECGLVALLQSAEGCFWDVSRGIALAQPLATFCEPSGFRTGLSGPDYRGDVALWGGTPDLQFLRPRIFLDHAPGCCAM
jgi:hypothetical protein